MAKSKIVNVYIEEGTLLRIFGNKNNADIIIEIAKEKRICLFEEKNNKTVSSIKWYIYQN